LHKLINSLLSLYGVNKQSLNYHLSYEKLALECSKLLFSSSIDSGFYKVIWVGISSFYFFDRPQKNNTIRQTLAKLGLRSVQSVFTPETEIYRNKIHKRLSYRVHHKLTPRLKIGYMTDFLYQHSVGWLVRWTLHHHNPDKFDIYTYSTFKPNDKIHDRLIEQYGQKIRHIPGKIKNITEQIQEDEIDILIDLGSLTESTNCVVTAVKPAPIQITWLGLDASQIPTVDYYLADRFSLPDEAQEYYSEKLIRMPHCYIAVDGFELDRPSISRADFGIPDDAVIYLSSQVGAKRHPDNMKLQVQILSQVPHSYFLVKFRRMDEDFALEAFRTLAIEMGVESDRIKVIPSTPTSEIHRANLKIADVILDTYPYNGATTTLEALWCEVPLVTRVGQQFAARNSYSMLMNVGVTEGIAWTDEEYVNWGVAFGLNSDLRDRVRWKLRQSKRSSPLWDARQFTRDLEQVYQQIWDCYLNKRNVAQRLA
jgi:predicted O-linked N-acetylglucosamine transferase (SPINDLY family)